MVSSSKNDKRCARKAYVLASKNAVNLNIFAKRNKNNLETDAKYRYQDREEAYRNVLYVLNYVKTVLKLRINEVC